MLVSMLALETRSSCQHFAKSWSKAEFSTGRLTAVNFIRYPASSIQLRYQLRQRQTCFYACSFLKSHLLKYLFRLRLSMLVSMLALETRSSCYLFTKSWSKAGFSTRRLTAVNFIRYPASSLQLRYQLLQRQTSFYTFSFLQSIC